MHFVIFLGYKTLERKKKKTLRWYSLCPTVQTCGGEERFIT